MAFVNYRNGNYVVYFNTETGDKIRNTHAAEFKPAFAENCDVTITPPADTPRRSRSCPAVLRC